MGLLGLAWVRERQPDLEQQAGWMASTFISRETDQKPTPRPPTAVARVGIRGAGFGRRLGLFSDQGGQIS